ncbi:hypothetical protein [Anthocerotibacter panamensis]|uniref:hypothetical protein n=1 Tax=Anthocerotibacter panamensis TaxID=2857077 RepID=UPI001C406051|nr:hypothetical protein [Anthocerotibacter panamensis]
MNAALKQFQATAHLLGSSADYARSALPALEPTVLPLDWPQSLDALYLPVVWTARGPLYAEAIGVRGEFLIQPWDLPDAARQVLYGFAQQVLRGHPVWGVYLIALVPGPEKMLVKGFEPMPSPIALVSTLVQKPDLFQAHLYCLQGWPLVELQIHTPGVVRLAKTAPEDALCWPGVVWHPEWLGCWTYPAPTDMAGHPFAKLDLLDGLYRGDRQ